MMERREEQLRDCILGMFNLSVQTGKRIFLRQTFVKLSLMRHQKLTYTSCLYLFNKSMSFILIKSDLFQILQYIRIA